ncbi:MAG: SirB2 family protein [Alcanivoracaceae bacterium]|nr:SirB2 family protein [Alcanivoracaceae bacterium]
MSLYLLLKSVHILCALTTAVLFAVRIGLDTMGRSWRSGPLRWIPHANDTVLLVAAIGLCIITGWAPLVHH